MSGYHQLFVLPRLVEKGLYEDNSKHYALPRYKPEPVAQACRLMVKSLADEDVPCDTKYHVRFRMEWLGAALWLPIGDHRHMTTAVKTYEKWLADSSFFGDSARQNKYIKLIITQLSLPFAFKEPSGADDFARFVEVLKHILDIYDNLQSTKGLLMEKATWVCLFNTMLGVCDAILEFNFQKFMAEDEVSRLRQKALDLLFSVLLNSGLKDEDVWGRFSMFSKSWNWNMDFVEVWGRRVDSLFKFVNARIYGFEPEEKLFQVGVYTPEKTIDNEMMSFVFHGTVFALDSGKMESNPDLMYSLAHSISLFVGTSRDVARRTSSLFLNKFPALSFLKLFGPFLTFAPVLKDVKFDKAVSVNIMSILKIIAHFDVEGAEEEMTRLIAYIIKRIDATHAVNLAAFLSELTSVYAFNSGFIPYLSEIALERLPQLEIAKAKDFQNSEFFCAVSSAFVSASEVLRGTPGAEKTIEQAFNAVWKIVHEQPTNRFALLCAAQAYGIPICDRLAEVFSEASVKDLMTSEDGKLYLTACIDYLGALVRSSPQICDEITKTKLIPLVIDATCKPDVMSAVVISLLLFIESLIEWGGKCLQCADNINSFFKFVDFMKTLIEQRKSGWSEELKATITSLFSLITARVNVHMPMNDYFTRRLDSSKEINEKLVIESMKMKDAKIYYYTVGQHLLVSFIEQADGSDPLVVFARGAFGKAIWTVADDYQGKLPTPKLSEEIPEVPLPEPKKIEIKPLNLKGEGVTGAPSVSMSELEAQDEALRKVAGKDFSKWLNWDVYGFYTPFNQKAPYQRPRVIDFLTTLGILDMDNRLSVRVQTDNEAIKSVIDRFDALEVSQIAPIIVTHILSDDETMDYSAAHHQRMTQLLQQFMREIAEPMAISDEAAQSHKLPELRTTVPMIVSADCFGAVLCPAMAKEESGARQIAEMANNTPIRIIFDETGFEVLPKDVPAGKQFVLIVKPSLRGLYHVWQISSIDGIMSPFSSQQTLTAQAIGFNISLLLELCTAVRSATTTRDITEDLEMPVT